MDPIERKIAEDPAHLAASMYALFSAGRVAVTNCRQKGH